MALSVTDDSTEADSYTELGQIMIALQQYDIAAAILEPREARIARARAQLIAAFGDDAFSEAPHGN